MRATIGAQRLTCFNRTPVLQLVSWSAFQLVSFLLLLKCSAARDRSCRRKGRRCLRNRAGLGVERDLLVNETFGGLRVVRGDSACYLLPLNAPIMGEPAPSRNPKSYQLPLLAAL